MSNADKMFEELGIIFNYKDEQNCVYSDVNFNITFDNRFKIIIFDQEVNVNLRLLKAINEKCKELGWNV